MLLEELIVPLLLDSKDFTNGLKNAKSEANSLQDGLSNVGKGVVVGALGLVASSVTAVTGGLVASTIAAGEAEKIQSQLNAVLESTGGISGMTAESVNTLATQLSNITPFEDDVIVSTENMLLTFTNLGKEVFPDVTEMALDMSQALGQDTKSSAMQLGKALNDPINGVTALTRVGVTFTDEQKTMIKTLQESGDLVGAQRVILGELSKEFGGSAEAAGKTFTGSLEIAKNTLGNIGETIMTNVLPQLTLLAGQFTTWLSSPEVQNGISMIATQLTNFATTAITYIPQIINWFQQVFSFLQNNQGIIVGILAALGVAVGAFVYTTVIPAAIAMISAMAPIIAVMALVGIAGYLLYQAWTTNFGGIRDLITNLWNNNLKPIFDTLVNWLKVNIPIALQTLSNFWKNTLLPAITSVWSWMKTNLFPFLESIGNLIGVLLVKNIQVAVATFNTVLLPALKGIWSFLSATFGPILKWIGEIVGDYLVRQFNNFTNTIRWVTDRFNELSRALSSMSLPSWLRPGSPPPLYFALKDIGSAMGDLNSGVLPDFNAKLNLNERQPVLAGANSNQSANSALIDAVKGISPSTDFDYNRLGRTIREGMLQTI